MDFRVGLVAALAAISGLGCAPEGVPEGAEGGWVGTITSEGGVTTVVNESGSVWGGAARLVEEASIGVEEGAEEYLFGAVTFVWATGDRIYVVDDQARAVRAYDLDGEFVQSFGNRGQGPGEYGYPGAVAVDAAGRVFVQDNRNARINVYTASGEVLDAWPKPVSICCLPMYPLAGDAIWASAFADLPGGGIQRGAQAFGPEGAIGEPLVLPEIDYEQATYQRGDREGMTPFSPYLTWTVAPNGKLLGGASDRYRFMRYGTGGVELVIERAWQPVRVAPEHEEWARRLEIAAQRDLNSTDVSLSAAQIHDHKPAFFTLLPALSGETWVARQGESVPVADCAGDPLEVGYRVARSKPCWDSRTVVDVFGADGRYLGDVDLPAGVDVLMTPPFLDGARVIAVSRDESDTIMVKRYRLLLPGQE